MSIVKGDSKEHIQDKLPEKDILTIIRDILGKKGENIKIKFRLH